MKSNRRNPARCLSVLLCLLSLIYSLPTLSLPAKSAEAERTAYAKPTDEINMNTLYGEKSELEDFSEIRWTGSDHVKSINITQYSGGTKCILASADTTRRRTLGMSRPFEQIDISGYSEISFAFLVLGTSDAEQSLRVSFVSGGTEYVYSVNIPSNGWYTVFCDVSDFSVKLLESVTVYTTSADQNAFVTSIAISSLMCGDTPHAVYAKRFSAIGITGGEISEDRITVKADDNAKAEIKADALIPDSFDISSAVAMRFTLEGLEGAKVSIGISDSPADRNPQYSEVGSVTVSDSSSSYAVVFTSSIKIVSWKMSFSAVSSVKETFSVKSVSFTVDGNGDGNAAQTPSSETLGTLPKCRFSYSDDSTVITVSGSLTHDSTVKYINDKLALYSVPAWESEIENFDEPLMEMEISTNFTFKVTLSDYPEAAAQKFAVAIITESGPVMLSSPSYPSPPQTAYLNTKEKKPLIVSAESKSDIFLSGASAVIAEVPLDQLIRTSPSPDGKLAAWGDSYFFLNSEILSSLDFYTSFCKNAGISVYFRIFSSTDMFISSPGQNVNANYFSLSVSDEEKASMLCAAVDFLSSRYSPAGYICGYPVNVITENSSDDFPNIFAYLKEQANVINTVYSVAASKNPMTRMIIPVDDCSSRKVNEISGNSDTVYNAETCVSVLDHFITLSGNTSWIVLLSISEMSQPNTVKSISASVEGGGFIGTAVYYDKVSDSISAVPMYQAISRGFDSAAAYGMKLAGMTGENNLAENVVTKDPDIHPLPYSFGERGTFSIWDFTRSFSSYSWTSSSNASRITTQISPALTEVSELTACRALHLSLVAETGGEECAVAAVPRKMNLSSCPYIEFILTAEGDGEMRSFTVTVGDSEKRYSYPVTIPAGEAYSVICTVEGNFSPEYFAVVYDEDEKLNLEIASVKALSKTFGDDELSSLVLLSQDTDAEKNSSTTPDYILAAKITAAVLSIVIFLLLTRKKRT